MMHESSIEKQPYNEKIYISSGHIMSNEDIEIIQKYLDECSKENIDIDFAKLEFDVYNQRVSNQAESGIHFDPIDDAPYMAVPEDIVGFMRPDQIVTHFNSLITEGSSQVADRIVAKMSPKLLASNVFEGTPIQTDPNLAELSKTFLNDHLIELLEAGANANKLAANLTPSQTKANKDLLIENGASRLKLNKSLALAALRRS